MRVSAALAVAFWGVVNGLLVAMLAGFGEGAAPVALYASVATLVELIAVAVWAGTRRRRRMRNPARPNWHAPNGDSILILAAAILIAALGVAFYPYLALAAVLPIAVVIVKEVSADKRESS